MINFFPVICTTQFGSCPPQYLSTRRLTSLPEIKSVSVTYRFPFVRQINVQLRTPLGAVGSPDQNSVWIADDSGVLFAQTDNVSLPLLILTREFKLSDKLSQPEIQSLKILNSISSFSNSRLVGQLNNAVLSFNLNSIQISASTDTLDSSWLASLQQLISRSRIDGKLPHKIDLRFSHPIVTY